MIHFVAPPGWPSGPAGWLPPAHWTPDEHWPTPPRGWVYYVDEYGLPADPGPYHWTPDDPASARSASTPSSPTTFGSNSRDTDFPEYRPSTARHRVHAGGGAAPAEPVPTFSSRGPFDPPPMNPLVPAGKPGRGPRVAVSVITAVLLMALVVVAVFLVRPALDRSPLAPVPSSPPMILPAPQDIHSAALTSLGFRCITERIDPVMVGCRQQVSPEIAVSARWVLDDEDEIITFQVYGNSSGQPSDTIRTTLAALLQLTTDSPQVEVLTTMAAMTEGTTEDIDLDWGSVELIDFGAAGLQQATATRKDGPPAPLEVKQFAVTVDEAQAALDTLGVDCTRAKKKANLECVEGEDTVAILAADDVVTGIRVTSSVDPVLLDWLLEVLVDPGEVSALRESVSTIGNTDPAASPAESIAGYLVLGEDDDEVRITRVLGWW